MPKKKGGKKGAKIIDGLATNEMSREQLMGHVKRMQMELEREREERNFFMLEREKLFSLWNMTLEQIAVEKDRARLIQVQLADGEKEREEEMKIHKQKLRFLMMEQSKKLATVRLQHLEKMKRIQDETQTIQSTMVETLNGKKMELAKAKSSIYEIIRRIREEYMEEITRIRHDCSVQLRSLESEFNRKLFAKQMNTRCDDVLANLNIPLAEQSEDLLQVHEKQLCEMKEFYNGITTNNLAIISALQNDLEESKSNENCLKMEIKRLKQQQQSQKQQYAKEINERKTSSYQLGTGKLERKGGQHKLFTDGDDKWREMRDSHQFTTTTTKNERRNSAKRTTNQKTIDDLMKRLDGRERYGRMLESKNEILYQRTLLLEKERQELKSTFANAIIEIQRKSSMSKLVSELRYNSNNSNKLKNGCTYVSIGYAAKQQRSSGLHGNPQGSQTTFITQNPSNEPSGQNSFNIVSLERNINSTELGQILNNLDAPPVHPRRNSVNEITRQATSSQLAPTYGRNSRRTSLSLYSSPYPRIPASNANISSGRTAPSTSSDSSRSGQL